MNKLLRVKFVIIAFLRLIFLVFGIMLLFFYDHGIGGVKGRINDTFLSNSAHFRLFQYVISAVISFFVVRLFFKRFNVSFWSKWDEDFLKIVASRFILPFISMTMILVYIFDIANFEYSKANKAIVIKVPIDTSFVHTYYMAGLHIHFQRLIQFKFNGIDFYYRDYLSKEDGYSLIKNDTFHFQNYMLSIKFRKGIGSSYVVEDYNYEFKK